MLFSKNPPLPALELFAIYGPSPISSYSLALSGIFVFSSRLVGDETHPEIDTSSYISLYRGGKRNFKYSPSGSAYPEQVKDYSRDAQPRAGWAVVPLCEWSWAHRPIHCRKGGGSVAWWCADSPDLGVTRAWTHQFSSIYWRELEQVIYLLLASVSSPVTRCHPPPRTPGKQMLHK